MLRLGNLRPAAGSNRRRKRVGRGYSSGHGGHESGKGTKGQNSRSGVTVRPGYEGGQTPFWMRFPKRGFHNVGRTEYAVINVGDLETFFEQGATVSLAVLVERGIVKDPKCGLKILGRGEITKALTVEADRFSRAAREKIEAAGGRAEGGSADADPSSGEEA